MRIHFLQIGGLFLLLSSLAAAQTAVAPVISPWQLDVGFNYLTGDYGLSKSTNVWLETADATYEQDAWSVQASLPVISISGPATIVGTVGNSGGAAGRPNGATETGFGDVTLAATRKLGPLIADTDFDFTVRVKLPTADEDKGLGTGRTDVYVETSFHRTIGEITPFGTVGYRFLGSSTIYPLKNGVYLTGGVAAPVGDGTVAGLSLSWRQRIVAGGDNATEVMGFAAKKLNARWKLQVYVLTGFTNASPKFGLGTQVAYHF